MRPLLLSLALLLVACGADPSPPATTDAAVVDTAADTASDVTQSTDAEADAAVDVLQDAASDSQRPDVIAVTDVLQDASADAGLTDARADAVAVGDAGPLDTRATSVSVVVRTDSMTWSTPRAQPTCTVTGGVLSVGADFDRPEMASFTALGPLTGPVTLGMVAASGSAMSDVRATITSGARYPTDGDTVQRVNVIVRGTPWPGFSVELAALGCVVR